MVKEKIETIIIDDSNEKWRAIITFYERVAVLGFERKPKGGAVQGYVDDTIGFDNIPTGINDLEVFADDGSFIVGFQDYSDEQVQAIKQPLIKYLTKLYEDNKDKFARNIKKDIRDYDKAMKEMLESMCQSCGRHRADGDIPLMSLAVNYGTEADGTKSCDYCIECYKDGVLTEKLIFEQMVEKYLNGWGSCMHESVRKRFLSDTLPNLKRWKK